MRLFLGCICSLGVLLGAFGQARADLIDVYSEGGVYGTVNTTTGTFAQLGTPGTAIEAMTRVGAGTIFAMSSSTALETINENTGTPTLVGTSGNLILAAAQRPSDSTLFGLSAGSGSRLFTINTGTGAATLVAPLSGATTSTIWYNNSFDNATTLYLVDASSGRGTNSRLFNINTTTGATTLIGLVGQGANNFNVDSLVFSNGVMFGFTDHTSVTAPDHIIRINLATGAGTDTGLSYANNGFSANDSIFGSVPSSLVPTPEPSSLLLCSMAAVGGAFGWCRRRQRGQASTVMAKRNAFGEGV